MVDCYILKSILKGPRPSVTAGILLQSLHTHQIANLQCKPRLDCLFKWIYILWSDSLCFSIINACNSLYLVLILKARARIMLQLMQYARDLREIIMLYPRERYILPWRQKNSGYLLNLHSLDSILTDLKLQAAYSSY